jgi:hypothetical protein
VVRALSAAVGVAGNDRGCVKLAIARHELLRIDIRNAKVAAHNTHGTADG